MAPEPYTILVRSHKCRATVYNGDLLLEFTLATGFLFSSRRFVRLFAATGLGEPVIVSLSFADLSLVDHTYGRFLALTAAPNSLPGPFVPVQGNFISSLSSLTIAKANGEAFEEVPKENIVLCLQVAPNSHVGANGNAGL